MSGKKIVALATWASVAGLLGLSAAFYWKYRDEQKAVERTPIEWSFVATLDGQPLSCDEPIHTRGQVIRLTDLRFFLHDVRATDRAGVEVPVALLKEAPFQTEGAVLIDFENGSAGCRNGTREINTRVRGTAPRGEYTSVQFRIGLSFQDNHANPDLAPPPLNLTAMQWSWLAGHTFLRFDSQIDGHNVVTHLGSHGCTGTFIHVEGCKWPNRPESGPLPYRPSGTIRWELGPLLTASIHGGDPSAPSEQHGCMGDPTAKACTGVFEQLGLSTVTGESLRPIAGFTGIP